MHDTETPPPRQGIFYGWILVTAIFIIVVFSAGIFMSFGVFLNPLLQTFGWTRGTVSLAYSIFMLTGGIGTLLIGGMLEHRSIRKILLIGGLIHAAGIMLTATTQSLWQLYLFYGVVASLGRSVFNISYVTLVNRWFHEKRGIAMGMIMSGQGMGPFLFSPLAGYLISAYSWQRAFFVMGLLMAIGIALASLFIRNSPEEMGLKPLGTPPPPVNTGTTAKQTASRSGGMWGEVVRTEAFWLLSLTHFFCCICHSIPLVHVAAFANVAGLSDLASAWVLGTMGLASFAGRLFWGFFSDKHGARFTLMITTVLQAVFILWLINAADPVVFVLYAIFWGFGYAGVTMQYGMIAKDIFPKHIMAPAYAGVSCFAMVGMASGGYLGGLLFDISHTYITAWWISLFTGIIAAFMAMELAHKAEQERRKHHTIETFPAALDLGDHATETAMRSLAARVEQSTRVSGGS